MVRVLDMRCGAGVRGAPSRGTGRVATYLRTAFLAAFVTVAVLRAAAACLTTLPSAFFTALLATATFFTAFFSTAFTVFLTAAAFLTAFFSTFFTAFLAAVAFLTTAVAVFFPVAFADFLAATTF